MSEGWPLRSNPRPWWLMRVSLASLPSPDLRAWARTRLPLLAFLLLAALLAADHRPAQPLPDLLDQAGYAAPVEVRWLDEPAPGGWRRALVRAAPTRDPEARSTLPDLLLLEALLDGRGQPMRLRSLGNLTRTPDADDHLLAFTPRHAAVGHKTDTGWIGLTLLDLRGDPTTTHDEYNTPRPLGDRLRIGLQHAQSDGAWRGVGRDHYTFDQPIPSLTAAFSPRELTLHTPEKNLPIRLEDGALLVDPLQSHLSHEREPWVLGKWSTWAANYARAVPWIGASRVARAERVALDLTEALRSRYWTLAGDQDQAFVEALTATPPPPDLPPFTPPSDGIPLDNPAPWPLPPIPPLDGLAPLEGEGAWKPWVPPWAATAPIQPEGPWPILRTAIRVDPRRAYDPIVLVALDMRQLDLNLLAGTHNPHSTTGYRGTGTIPRDPDTLRRLVLAFNGGFKTSHGAYGMMLHGRTFIPPKPATATVALDKDGTLRMGTWPGAAPSGNYNREREFAAQAAQEGDAPPPPPHILSYRQNLPPLIEGGALNPTGAVRWGGTVDHLSSANTPRSGICIRAPHTLMYVWGAAASAADLGRAMLRAGCDYGMHLDMNPFHTGLALYHVPTPGDHLPPEDPKLGFQGAQAETPAQRMAFDTYRYLRTDLKDFFYVTWATTLRQRLGSPPPGASPWSTQGLPTRQGGLQPLALLADQPGLRVVAFERGAFRADLLPSPNTTPDTAPTGALRLIVLPTDRADHNPWRNGPAPGQPVLLPTPYGLDILPDGAALTPDQAALPGEWLLRDRAWTREDLPATPHTLIAASLLHGDLALITCDACDPRALRTLLEHLPAQHALLLPPAHLLAAAKHTDNAWTHLTPPRPADLQPLLLLTPNPAQDPVAPLLFNTP